MRHRFHCVSIVAFLAIASVAVSACGGEAEEVSAYDEDTIARADFIQAANAACEERIEQMKARSRRIYAQVAEKSRDAGARLLIEQVVVPGFEGEAKDLRALEPPPGEEEEVEAVIVAIEEMVARTRRDLAKGRNYPYRRTENLAAAYGLPDCGHP